MVINPKVEMMPTEEKVELILQRFRKNLRWALEKSSFYKKKYNGLDIHAEDIKTLSDIRNLPVTTRDELIQASAFDLLTGPLSQTLRFNRTISGLYRGFTADDIARNIDIAIRPLASNDINKTSTLIICGNYSSQYLLDLHYAAEALGATVLPCNSVDAAIDVVSSELTSFKETTASKDSAQTVVNNQALSRINTAEGKITTLQSTSVTKDKAQSTHTIKTQAIAGGKTAIAGIAIGAMANEITSESQVIVMADKFGVVRDASDGVVKPMLTVVNNQVAVNGDLIADGTILGQHIKANQTITAPVINGGELNINNRFKVDKFGNTTIQSSAGNVGLKITDEKIEVYDAAGRLRVRLGKLS